MMSKAIIVISIMIGYFVLNAVIIKISTTKQLDLETYAVGNRSFGFMLNAFSGIGAWYCGAMYVGWFATAADTGIFAQYIIVYSTIAVIVQYYEARPVWIWGKEYGLETEGDYVAKRYGSEKFRWVFMTIFFIFYAPWLIVEIKALGYMVHAATYYMVGYNVALIIAVGFVIAYTFFGGAKGTAVGGLVQGITMGVVGVIFLYWMIHKAYGGVFDLYALVEEFKPQLLSFRANGAQYWASVIITCGLGGFILPAIFYRLYMTDSPRTTKKAVLFAPLLGIIMGFLVMALGLGSTYFDGFPADSQQASFWIVDKLGGPVGLGLLGVLGLAASMSSIACFLNCFAIMISKDIVAPLCPNISRDKLFKIARVATIAVGVIAVIISMFEVAQLMYFVIAIYDCCVQAFPLIFIGLFWRKANLQGAICGFTIGSIWAVLGVFWPETIAWAGGWTGGFIGLVCNTIAIVVCGLIFGKQDHVDEMFDLLKNYKEPRSRKAL